MKRKTWWRRFLCKWWDHKLGRARHSTLMFKSWAHYRNWHRTNHDWGYDYEKAGNMYLSYTWHRCVFCGYDDKPWVAR